MAEFHERMLNDPELIDWPDLSRRAHEQRMEHKYGEAYRESRELQRKLET